MPTTYKRLATVIPSSTKTQIYSPGTGKQAIISSLVVTNTSGATRTFSIYAMNSISETEADANTIGKNLVLAANATVAFTEGWTFSGSDALAATCAEGSGLNFNLFGCEIS
jgi:hypothetical protein